VHCCADWLDGGNRCLPGQVCVGVLDGSKTCTACEFAGLLDGFSGQKVMKPGPPPTTAGLKFSDQQCAAGAEDAVHLRYGCCAVVVNPVHGSGRPDTLGEDHSQSAGAAVCVHTGHSHLLFGMFDVNSLRWDRWC
jgi:hypothetical protein